MDNLGGVNSGGQHPNDPIPLDGGAQTKGVSHAPLDLGGAGPVLAPQSVAPKPVARPSGPPAAAVRPVRTAPPTGSRIRAVKTFFTKLHPGAIDFLDEQITRWLSENPDVAIKQTNVTVGEVQAKKTEPNILVTVWY
ncbi:MAG TPA: hypothetical protein VMW24_12810 [Sedimentisphaerales bacterium]|jgi:hypothetical protein|nr:hypothetical protein [Sedimentisphaerales bacterium]